jgi:hypothetical protein
MSGSNKSNKAQITATIVAIFALAVSIYSLVNTNNRLNEQEKKQYAAQVYLGEALPDYYARFGHARTVQAVFNTSRVQINDVWVENGHGESVQMGMIQPCTYYTLYAGFVPTVVHFKDPYGSWRRGAAPTSQPEPDSEQVPEAPYKSEHTIEIESCSH